MFGNHVKIAVQDPSYPIYVDGSVIIGATGNYNNSKNNFDNIVYMKCSSENNFFPDLSEVERTDLIYFCSPNNPTGAVATREQLKELVDFAKRSNSIIIFDAAYAEYIEEDYPKTIYDSASHYWDKKFDGSKLTEREKLETNGIEMKMFTYSQPIYKQYQLSEGHEFVPYLSIYDLIFNYGENGLEILEKYKGKYI